MLPDVVDRICIRKPFDDDDLARVFLRMHQPHHIIPAVLCLLRISAVIWRLL